MLLARVPTLCDILKTLLSSRQPSPFLNIAL